jgi:hypothetical protein
MSLIVGLPKETQGSWLKTKLWVLKNWREESMTAYPLYIPVEGQTQAPSLLTEHWSKYGYRESPLNWIEQANEYLNNNGAGKELKQSINLFNDISSTNPGLNWENDHWNRLSATLEVGKWIAEYKTYNPPCPWTIGKWMLATGRPREFFNNKTYKKICDEIGHLGEISVMEANNTSIREYILKKLNWLG